MMLPLRRRHWVLSYIAFCIAGCTTYAEDLNRGQQHYQSNEYERALASLRALEPDIDSLGATDRARYAYLRGMTDYRLSLRADARHWLSLARTLDSATPGGLQDDWKARMGEALTDLNKDYYGVDPAASASAAAPAPASSAIPGDLFKH